MQIHEQEKWTAAHYALRYVREGDVVGLGSGSTATDALRLLGERVGGGLKIRGIPTSRASAKLAAQLRIPLITFEAAPQIDVTIDGADEVDPRLRLIKGGGGALLREKIVASASRKLIIVADSSKWVQTLGRFPLPVEIIPFARALVARRIAALGAKVRLREDKPGKPYVTDEGHWILDCRFGRIRSPETLALKLSQMPGVVEHGLFINYADVVLLARGSKVEVHRRER